MAEFLSNKVFIFFLKSKFLVKLFKFYLKLIFILSKKVKFQPSEFFSNIYM